uniref:Glutamate 5-kinase n=1 Tax=Tetraselmis sp. GSL018 TaxID=582737 RepID=A0A061QL43_9CHLO|mmetsp:Transcript_18246/g.43640  ORF Transcript_18246/g.43640 Transcript_18246/m.43640 type:complete len:435 (-) Transcript_18246:294-1598(-)
MTGSVGGKPTVVIKVGTSSLVAADNTSLSLGNIARLCEVSRDLHRRGFSVVLVSSGAVGVGCQRLRLGSRPQNLAAKQALAAVGQLHLMRYYDDMFGALGLSCAQVLLTLDNFASRSQYLNARNTFEELLKFGVVPIVNENDTVAVEQLRFGDNDTLSAQVATLLRAEWLFLLTDVDCVYTANPNSDPNAEPIHEVHNVAELQVDTSTRGTQWGTGGMATKLTAARIATAAGCKMAISHAAHVERILGIVGGERLGTVFHPVANALRGRRRWILSVPVKGELWLDDGAVHAVKQKRKSLFSVGVKHMTGEFSTDDAVSICNMSGEEFARGLANYNAADTALIAGKPNREHQKLLGYSGSEYLVHRDNISLLPSREDGGVAAPGEEGSDEEDDSPDEVDESNEKAELRGVLSEASLNLIAEAQEDVAELEGNRDS